jgi:hypothetical protein
MGRVDDGALAGDGFEPVLDDADLLEQRGKLPHDPVRHALHAKDQPDGKGDGSGGHGFEPPQPERQRCHREQEEGVERVEGNCQQGDKPHLPMDGAEESIHAVAGISVLALGMGKHLDRRDVGVAVDNPPGHQRAGLGLLL